MKALLLVAALAASAAGLDNGVGATPALGWSSWNYFGNDINESLVLGIADGMVSSGLRDAGFEYVNLDAGVWLPDRSAVGELVADAAKFPRGIASLARAVHRRGLKLGLYTDLSSREAGKVCGTGPGSYGHYARDAATLAALGCDFLKVDYCAYDQPDPARYVPSIPDSRASWAALAKALNGTGRPIYTYLCPRSFRGSLVPPDPKTGGCRPSDTHCITDGPPREWPAAARAGLANAMLTEGSNSRDSWASAMANLDALLALRPSPDWRGPGFFSDGDMLHTCSFGRGQTSDPSPGGSRPRVYGMALHEYAAQLAVYAVLASPIVISADLRELAAARPECVALLTNKDLLRVSQDPAAHAPRACALDGEPVAPHAQCFSRPMADGSVALVLLNRGAAAAALNVTFAQLGLPAGRSCAVRDLLARAELDPAAGAYAASVGAHEAAAVRISC